METIYFTIVLIAFTNSIGGTNYAIIGGFCVQFDEFYLSITNVSLIIGHLVAIIDDVV